MDGDVKRLHQLRLEGKCCSAVLLQLALELRGEENPGLVQASTGLCLGVHSGLTCGALTGAACMLSLFDEKLAATEMIPQLAEWFTTTYGALYQGADCRSILGGRPENKALRCPSIIESTYLEAREILQEFGFDLVY